MLLDGSVLFTKGCLPDTKMSFFCCTSPPIEFSSSSDVPLLHLRPLLQTRPDVPSFLNQEQGKKLAPRLLIKRIQPRILVSRDHLLLCIAQPMALHHCTKPITRQIILQGGCQGRRLVLFLIHPPKPWNLQQRFQGEFHLSNFCDL